MRQSNYFERINLKQKGEQILCNEHKLPIILLDIGQNVNIGKRLICEKCETFGKKVLFFEQVEGYLNQWQQEESQMIDDEQNQFNTIMQLTDGLIEEIKNKFSLLIKKLTIRIQQYQNNFALYIKNYSDSELRYNINQITHSQVINSSVLQELATFVSSQPIVEGKLQLQHHFQFSGQNNCGFFKKQMEKLINQLTKFDSKLTSNLSYNEAIQIEGHSNQVNCVAISENEKYIASGDLDKNIILWNLADRSQLTKYKGVQQIKDLIFSENNQYLVASLSKPPEIVLFKMDNLAKFEPAIRLSGHKDTIWRTQFMQNNQYLISASKDKTIKIWDLSKANIVTERTLSNEVNCVAVSQQFVSACCGNGKAYLFQCQTISDPILLVIWQAHEEEAYGTTFSPDSEFLLTSNKEVKIWKISQLTNQGNNCAPVKVIVGEDSLWNLSIQRFGSLLISNDEKIKIWNLKTGRLLTTIEVPEGYEYIDDRNFAVTKDMKCIVTGGKNMKLKLFQLKENQE